MSTDRVSSEVAMLAEGVSSDNSKVDRYKVPSDVAMLADKAVDRYSTVSRFRVPSAAAVQHSLQEQSCAANLAQRSIINRLLLPIYI
jgi:hypothetical protein